jgi:hypothetical protein
MTSPVRVRRRRTKKEIQTSLKTRMGAQRRRHHLDPDWQAANSETCYGCGRKPTRGELLGVDHDHKHCSGSESCGLCVRGMCCRTCNGHLLKFVERMFRGNRERGALYLERMADYVRHGGAPGSPNRRRLEALDAVAGRAVE